VFTCIVFGLIDSLFVLHGIEWLAPATSLSLQMALAAAIFAVTAAWLPSLAGRRYWAIGIEMFLGIALGVGLDAIGDKLLFANDRLLFPIEIVLWWLFAFLPVAVGLTLRARVSGRG